MHVANWLPSKLSLLASAIQFENKLTMNHWRLWLTWSINLANNWKAKRFWHGITLDVWSAFPLCSLCPSHTLILSSMINRATVKRMIMFDVLPLIIASWNPSLVAGYSGSLGVWRVEKGEALVLGWGGFAGWWYRGIQRGGSSSGNSHSWLLSRTLRASHVFDARCSEDTLPWPLSVQCSRSCHGTWCEPWEARVLWFLCLCLAMLTLRRMDCGC